MRNFFKSWKALFIWILWSMFGAPCYQEFGSTIWESRFGVIPRDFQIAAFTPGLCLILFWLAFWIEAHWPTIMRWLRIARTWMYRDRFGIAHFGTIHGDLSVRLDNEDNTIEDIQRWLAANKLNASVSEPYFMGVVKRASENRRKKRKK